jgi:hypothetical protein
MPFQVFRRHQRKMMAGLAIFAMIAFTLDFSLFRSQFGAAAQDRVVVELHGRRVRQSEIANMMAQRSRANDFMVQITGRPDYFGRLDTRSIVDALILQHEADRLGMPVDKNLAVKWLRERTDNQLTTALFDQIYQQRFADRVTDTQLLEDIANQIRLSEVASLPGFPPITPLDVYEAYRDQHERVSVHAVAFRAEDYLKDVPDPSPEEIQRFYDRYKDVLPDRARDTPGFKIPRKIRVEYVSKDAGALAREIEQRLTEQELRAAYEARKDDFPLPPPELPVNLFAEDPDASLTPDLTDPFLTVRESVARTLAAEKAREQIDAAFGAVRDEVITPFNDRYGAAQDAANEAKEAGRAPEPLPQPGDALKKAAEKHGLTYEATPEIDRELAASYGQISGATRGGGALGGGTSFADVFFDPRSSLYEEVELSDLAGRRYLAWKIADIPARVPRLDEIRSQVVHELKLQKARDLARRDAEKFADDVRKADGDIQKVAGNRSVLTTPPITKLQPGLMLNPYQPEPARPTEILQIPDASDALREAYFDLQPRQVVVEPNKPRTIYYVMTLNQRYPAEFAGLYAPFGRRQMLQNEVLTEAIINRSRDWMAELRQRAGLPPNWVPPDEEARAKSETDLS